MLLRKAISLLQAEGIACTAIDLTKIGSQDSTPDRWYAGIIRRLVNSFHQFKHFFRFLARKLQSKIDGLCSLLENSGR
jgi:hypothetical protein